MKVAILAGGIGSRMAGETEVKPKPMIEIGGKPILWHIMMHYGYHGFKDFIIALGYKGEVIKKYMVDYCSLNTNLTVNLKSGEVAMHECSQEDWTVQLIDTGMESSIPARLKCSLDNFCELKVIIPTALSLPINLLTIGT